MATTEQMPEQGAGGKDHRATIGSTGAMIFGGLAALVGLCCVGPLAVAVFGVSGAVLLARFEPAKPVLVGLAVAFAVWSAWWLYLRPLMGRAAWPNIRQQLFFGLSWLLILVALFADRLVGVLI